MRLCTFFLLAALLVSLGAWAENVPIRPDHNLTPGIVASTDEEVVCATGPNGSYSQQHRKTTSAMKREVYQRYGIDRKGRSFEIDHRLPLALGGADDVKNLWPQEGWHHPSYHDKDELEQYLWRSVCKKHTMPLRNAQSLLLGDWIVAYKQVFGNVPGATRPVPARAEHVCLPRRFSHLLLRTGPGREYPEIGPMVDHTELTVLGRKADWLHVRTDSGHSGWAYGHGICPDAPGAER